MCRERGYRLKGKMMLRGHLRKGASKETSSVLRRGKGRRQSDVITDRIESLV